eukprot:3496579-Rhodomonas_salina.1
MSNNATQYYQCPAYRRVEKLGRGSESGTSSPLHDTERTRAGDSTSSKPIPTPQMIDPAHSIVSRFQNGESQTSSQIRIMQNSATEVEKQTFVLSI